jgi:hypothetical protein
MFHLGYDDRYKMPDLIQYNMIIYEKYLKANDMIEHPISRWKADSKVDHIVATVGYVKEMAHELAELANSAGCPKLSEILTLASHEARLCHFKFTGQEIGS